MQFITICLFKLQLTDIESPPSLRTATPKELIAALQDPQQYERAKAEAWRRISSNVATKLAGRFLLPTSESDRQDAFDGLVGLCWKARGNLCVMPTYSELAQGKTLWECTHEFVEDFVLDHFERYQDQSESQILTAALENEFRYIGRRLWSRMRDEIRTRTALKNQEPISLDERRQTTEAEDVSPTADSHSTLSGAVEPRFTNSTTPLEFVRTRETSLTDALGKTNYEVLVAATEVFPEAYSGTHQQCKSALTEAIRRKRGGVSEQIARANKRDLLEKVSAEMHGGNRELNDLHELIATGDDENTLREEFVSRDGRRKRSIRFHIKFGR